MPWTRSVSRDQDGRLGLEALLALLVCGDLTQGRGHAIRRVQDRLIVAPGRGQGERLTLLCLPRLESIQEGLQGRGRGPSPPVNSLIRVAHRGDSMVAEQHGQQVHLDDGRVLELVEENRAELLAQRLANRRGLAHDARGQDELVGKVQHAHVPLALLVFRDGVKEGDAATVRPQQAPRVVVRLAHLFELAPKVHEGLPGTLHRVPVLGDLPSQVQNLADCAQGREVLVEVSGPGLDDLQHEVQSPGLGEHREVGVDADTHPVLGHDAFGEGVVGEGHGVFVKALTQLWHLAREQPDAFTQALPQLACRLAREGEAQNRRRAQVRVIGEEPQHAHRHGLGLTRPRSRHDEQRATRGLDDAHLLGRRRLRRVDDCLNLQGTQGHCTVLSHVTPPPCGRARVPGTTDRRNSTCRPPQRASPQSTGHGR